MTIAKLLYDNGPNWLYATGVPISDPTYWYQSPNGTTALIAPDLELAMLRQANAATHIHLMSDVRDTLIRNGTLPDSTAYVQFLIGADAPSAIMVPADFPLAMADKLRAAGLNLITPEDTSAPFFESRYVKTMAEIEKLAAAQQLNEAALAHAVHLLKQADIARDDTLFLKGQALTAQFMQAEINKKALELGATEFSGGPIVACGVQGAHPHERGHGPLKAHQLIVIDTFPRHQNGYWGDLTRTFVKGRANTWQQQVYHLVLQAQKLGLSLLKQGADGKTIDAEVTQFFIQNGHPRGKDASGTPYGYIHSLGHSVGLELHDPGAGLSRLGKPLKAGSVLTVEPGLYYPSNVNGGIGGVRIEDMVAITSNGHTNLTSFPTNNWVIS